MFGDKGKRKVTKELTQIHNMENFIPMDYKKLKEYERVEEIFSLMFLVEKRDGRIKEDVA